MYFMYFSFSEKFLSQGGWRVAECWVVGLGVPVTPALHTSLWGQVQGTVGHMDSQLSLDTADSRALFRTFAGGWGETHNNLTALPQPPPWGEQGPPPDLGHSLRTLVPLKILTTMGLAGYAPGF